MPSFPKDNLELHAEMEKLYDDISGVNEAEMRTFESMIILAYKD